MTLRRTPPARLGLGLGALLLVAGTAATPMSGAAAAAAPELAARASACATPADFDGDGVDDVAVGDPFADDDKGSVYVVSGQKVVPVAVPGLARGDGFGWSARLAKVDGDACADLLVGAPYADVDGEQDAGAVYVVYGGGTRPPLRLTAPQPQRLAHFGWSLAVRDDLLAVSAPYEDDGQLTDAGAVYVRKGAGQFRRISQESDDVRGNSEVGDQFGWSMAWGPKNALLVGVPYENDDGAGRQVEAGKINSGSAVFIDDVFTSKITSLKLDSPSDRNGDRYGYAVAYSEGSGYAISSPGSGSVQLLNPARKVVRTVTQGGRQAFGFALAASADGRLAIGAPYGGGVRVVSWKDAAEDRKLTDADGLFGWSVAFSGNKLFVGQPDARPAGKVAVAGRNAEALETLQPPEGAEFGAAVSG
ncbi:integrin alpha [Actinomadura sp. ATCC 31491]|uniref:Integrin alpha n=1 Tax=Actinomadura luzonensis TaxID=2805427 RepID=A0ABT0FLT6_9ACTN|nr:integrin alpha [Actinomadura luzonensis]MCK2213246.1 integrin alpha [Actinomadura luzonensis]